MSRTNANQLEFGGPQGLFHAIAISTGLRAASLRAASTLKSGPLNFVVCKIPLRDVDMQAQEGLHDRTEVALRIGAISRRATAALAAAVIDRPGFMNAVSAFLILLVAAILEAGGDAMVRHGLQGQGAALRIGFLILGGVLLFAYGVTVNSPPWDFGKILGVYVTLFFLIAQVINLVVFGVRPGAPILVGGTMIVSGGLIMALWRV